MPEAAARSTDGGVFTDAVLQWLHRHGCRGVHPLDADAAGADTVEPAWTTVATGPHATPTSGWRFGWHDAAGRTQALLLAFAEADQLPEAARRGLSAYLDLAGRCADATTGSAHLLDRAEAAKKIHDLRNGLNSLLMNAAVMAAKLPPADRDGRFATQVQLDGERCAALLQELSEAIRGPDAPRAG